MKSLSPLKTLEFFLILIPLSIITGPFLADALLVFSIIIYIIFFLKKKIIFLFQDKILFFFLLFFLFILLNSLFNNGNFYSIKTSFTFIRFIFFYLAIFYVCETLGKNFFDKLYYLFIIIFLALFVDSSFQLIFDKNILNFKSTYPGRISSLFGDELILGSYISKFYPLFFYLHIKKFGYEGKSFFLLFISIITYFTTLISGERIAFLSINLFYILLIIYYFRFFFSKKILFFLVLIVSINTISFLNSSIIKDRYFQKTFVQVITNNDFKIESKNIRKNSIAEKINNNLFFKYVPYEYRVYFLTSTNILSDNFLFGTGTKSYRYFCSDKNYVISEAYSCSTHPHNFYFQMLAENGIIGFSFLAVFNIYCFLNLIKMILPKKKFNFSYPLLSGIFVFYFPFLFTGNVFNNMVCIFSFFVIGFYMYEKNKLS